MSKLIKIDKRNRTVSSGYCLLAGQGWLTIVQGGNGQESDVIRLHGAELEQFMADVDHVISQMATNSVRRAS